MGVLGDFPLSHEPIPSLEGIEEKSEHSEELCNFNPPKLELLELGEEFKFDDFLFLKYPEEFISEKRRGIHESITETELKSDIACISALSGPKAIESELPIIQRGASNVDFSQSKDNSGDLFIFPFISMLEPIGECNMASHVSHEVTFDQLQQGVHDSDCEENYLYTTQAVQTRRRSDHGYRSQSSQSLLLLGPGQTHNYSSSGQPSANVHELRQGVPHSRVLLQTITEMENCTTAYGSPSSMDQQYHSEMKIDWYRAFWIIDWPSMAPVPWIICIYLMVKPQEVTIPADKHAQWKKQQQCERCFSLVSWVKVLATFIYP